MTNREEVISKIEEEISLAEYWDEPYRTIDLQLLIDTFALLKEQETKRPVVREKNGYWNYICPTCGSHNEELFREWNYCPFCGQAVKWE